MTSIICFCVTILINQFIKIKKVKKVKNRKCMSGIVKKYVDVRKKCE